MTYKIKYTLCLTDGSSTEKETNVKNRFSEYDACSSLYAFLKKKYPDYKSHSIDSCEEIYAQSREGEEQVEFLKGIFGIK